jgi:hypothetical protein
MGCRRGTGSLAFHAFSDQLIARLQEPQPMPHHIAIVGIPYHDRADRLDQFHDTPAQITVVPTTWKNQIRYLAAIAGRTLGLISTETPLPPGTNPHLCNC